MDLQRVAHALQQAGTVAHGVRTLFHYNAPLSEKEAQRLTEFNKLLLEQLEGGLKVEATPPEVAQLAQRPVEALHPLMVVQCIISASRIPSISLCHQRVMQKQLLSLVATQTPLTLDEWGTALLLVAQLPINYSRTCLRCAEEVLRAAAPVVLAADANHGHGATHAVTSKSGKRVVYPRKNTTAAKLKPVTLEEARMYFMKVLAAVMRQYAVLHAQVKKSSLHTTPHGDEVFLQSRPVRRLQRIAAVCPASAQDECAAIVRQLGPVDAVSVTLLAPWAPPLTKDQLSSAVKASPLTLHLLLGALHVTHGALRVAAPEEVVTVCLYTMGLTTTTKDMFRDLISILIAISGTAALFNGERGRDLFVQLFTPFVYNQKVLSPAVAHNLAPLYADLFASMQPEAAGHTALCAALRQAVVLTLTTKCRASNEKLCVLQLYGAMSAVLPVDLRMTMDGREELAPVLDRELSIPVAESVGQALRLVGLFGLSSLVQDGCRAALKNARRDEAIRRALLVHLDPAATAEDIVAELTTSLLGECAEVEVVRPDAFLALLFVAKSDGAVVRKLCPLLSTADVLGALGPDEAELERAAQVAVELATAGQYSPLAMLLTHRSGLLRRRLVDYVGGIASQVTSVIPLWDNLIDTVFGLEKPVRPRILSQSADSALLVVASALLRHTAKLTITVTLAELLLCCGHDNVQGHDPDFYKRINGRLGRSREASRTVNAAVFRRIFTEEHAPLLSQHVHSLVEAVGRALSGPEHTATAACRGVALLLTKLTPAASAEAFQLLFTFVKRSDEFLSQLDARDQAIAAANADVMQAYEDATLREQQLLKNYPERPPKGVSEDDFADMKKKDGVALAKGRATLQAAVAQRAVQIADLVRQQKTPFVAVRLVGTNGGFDVIGIAVLLPYLQAMLNRDPADLPRVLHDLALDCIIGLLSHTPLGPLAANIATTIARLWNQKTLTVQDVAQVAAMAQGLRLALPQMLPAPLFVVLTRFAKVAFKAGRGTNAMATTIPVATQHQILSVLSLNIGQANLPEPTETMELLDDILTGFPHLFKSVQQGVQTLMSMIPSSRLVAIEAGLFSSTDSVREVTALAYGRFAHFTTCRRALVLAAVFTNDESANVVRSMTSIVQEPRYGWVLTASDWDDLLYFLATYGRQRANALRVVQTMKDLFLREETSATVQSKWVEDITGIGGLGSVVALQVLSSSFKGNVADAAINYLCGLTEQLTTGEALMRSILDAGRVVLGETDIAILKAIAPQLQTRLAKPPKDATAVHKEQYLATATVWLTIISCRLQETDLLEAIIEQQSRTIHNSQSAMVHRCVCESMVEITKNPTVRHSPKLDEFVEKCLKQVTHSGSYVKKKAHAWGLVGVLKGLGLTSLRRYHIMDVIQKSSKEKQTEKSGAMVLVEVLCDVLGTKFEPYALAVSHILLEGVADPDPKVSECADDSARVMMSSLSGVGLRQLIPRLVGLLSSDNAKKRVAPLNFIGYVAFCSPKQLAATLPEIMKQISACLFDVNNAVSVAAFNALRRVAGVVSNPEIQEHVNIILNAMRSPSTDTEAALDALLYTRFINVVDPASLALIIPVISRGLGGQMPHTRPKAAQIVATMVMLVGDAKSLHPYSDELVRLLEEAAQDPQAEARTTSAKAIGALAAAVGGKLVDEIAQWCFSVLQRVQSGTVEKAGAAQVFVELVSACGDELLQVYFTVIESGMQDERPPVREGFLYIMVYAPSTFSSECFQTFLPVAFPWVLEGLSHFSDKVRDVALVAGDSIISLYGTRNLIFVLEPLLDGVMSEVTTLRHSSLLLAAKLMLHLVSHIKKKMRLSAALENMGGEDREVLSSVVDVDPEDNHAAEDPEDTGVLMMEAAREVEKRGVSILGALEEQMGTSHLVRMLAALFCGRHEHNVTVRGDSNLAWQACVASIRAAVNKIFDDLVQVLVHFGSSDNPDCVDVAQKTIEFTTRINETIERFINAFCDCYKVANDRAKLGSLICLATVVQYADPKKLVGMGGQIVGCVLPGMQDKDAAVQEAAREVFAKVSKSVGSRLIESAVEAQLNTSVRGVVEVVKVKPSIALALVFKYLNSQTTFTATNLELVDAILDVEEADEDLRRYSEDLVRLLLAFLVQGLDGAVDVMRRFVETLPSEFENIPVEAFQKAMNNPESRHGALLAAEAYGLGTDVDNVEGIAAVFRVVISALGDSDADIRLDAVRILPELIASLESRVVEDLEEEEQQDVTVSKRAAGRYLLQYLDVFQSILAVTARATLSADNREFTVLAEGEPRLFDVLMTFYNRGLDYGTPQQKVEAVECIQDVMEFAPRAISAAAANTVAGRCSKVLFTRNEGAVVLALVRLCLQLMHYPASGKEKMVEGTMALAMFNAALCDSGEARVLALRVVIQLLQRSEKYADLILGTVITKKAAVDSPLLRTVMCRFVATVIHYGNYEKASQHVVRLMDLVRPLWEKAESPAQAAAAGVAVGALCRSASVSEEVLSDIKERTLATTSTKGVQAIAGFALVFSLITNAPARTDRTFLDVAAEHLRAAAAFGASDKLTTLWMLRAGAAIASTGCVDVDAFKVEAYLPLLRRVDPADEGMMSTAQYFIDCVTGAYPSYYTTLESLPHEYSSQWNVVGDFDANLDDEAVADSAY